jgi:hypothetical protein
LVTKIVEELHGDEALAVLLPDLVPICGSKNARSKTRHAAVAEQHENYFWICRRCNRGQQYCSEPSRQQPVGNSDAKPTARHQIVAKILARGTSLEE